MKRRTLLMMTAMFPWLGACAGTGGQMGGVDVRGIGMVVEDELAPGASTKDGVQGVSDTGQRLFAHASLTATGGGTGTYGGGRIPRWVRVTWRGGMTAYLPGKDGQYATGKVVGDYTVPVLERIPAEAFALTRAGRKEAVPGAALPPARRRRRLWVDGAAAGRRAV